MIRRLEQVAALVVAAGLALVSYWLFFSWARGGGAQHRLPRGPGQELSRPRQARPAPAPTAGQQAPTASKTAPGLE
jgi:hypothetical protein